MRKAEPGSWDEDEVAHTPIGQPGAHARPEFVGLYLYLSSMAAFLTWLLVFGVNV